MSTVWFSVSEPRTYYRIPTDFEWDDEGVALTNFELQLKRASSASISPFEISKSDAFGGGAPTKRVQESVDASNVEKEVTQDFSHSEEQQEPSIDKDMGVLGVLGILKGVVDEGLSMGEELLEQLDKDEAVALAKEVVDEALEVVSDIVEGDSDSDDSGQESVTGLHLRSLFRQGLKDFRFSIQPREKGGTDSSEG